MTTTTSLSSASTQLTKWRARALIDLTALRNNISVAKRFADKSIVYAVVKANAYGHGVEHIAPVLQHQVDGLAVATLGEGVACRAYAPSAPLIVLSEFNDPDQLPVFDQYNLQIVIHHSAQIAWLQQYRGNKLRCWLKIDSGMNRLGVAPNEVASVVPVLEQCENIELSGFFSHLASADNPEDPKTGQQLHRFLDCVGSFDGLKSIANSAGLVNWPTTHLDLVRPGLLMFGASPLVQKNAHQLELEPVMSFETRLISVKQIGQGQGVGYGASWSATRPTRIGIAGSGYADGYPRSVSNRGFVMINGNRAPIVGQISMDMMTLDLSACPDSRVGDTVQLWGPQLPVETVARWADTIPYELLCRVSSRVPRVSIN